MKLFVFIYNIGLISLFAVAIAAAIYACVKTKALVFSGIAALFFLCYVDNAIISMTELFSFFAIKSNEIMLTSMGYKTVILLATDACYLFINEKFLSGKVIYNQYFWVLGRGLFLTLLPLFATGAPMMWLYYSSAQFFLIGLAIYSYRIYKHNLLQEQKENPFAQYYKQLLFVSLFFAICILIEDSYVIFFVDQYTNSGETTIIFNRNISDDILSAYYAVFFLFVFFKTELSQKLPLPLIRSVCTEPEETIVIDTNASVFDRFCAHYLFTDREKDLMRYILENKTNQEISDELYISLGTVKTHIHNIYNKVEVSKRSMLTQVYAEFR